MSGASGVLPTDWRAYAESLPREDYVSSLIDLAAGKLSVGRSEELEDYVTKCYELYACLTSTAFLGKSQSRGEATQRRNNVKLKKTYEIEEICCRLGELLEEHNLQYAIDVGAGQGYLAMELAKHVGSLRTIIAIECSDIQLHGMVGRLQDISSRERDIVQLRKVRLDSSRSACEFEQLVFPADLSAGSDAPVDGVPSYLMYSLHACGSLSETMIQLFCDSTSQAHVLFNIACCYNLIDETLPGRHFPMSQKMACLWKIGDGNPHFLSRNMKMVACQAPRRWHERPEQTKKFFKRHFYRSLLEKLLHDLAILAPDEESRIANIGDSALGSFKDYVTAAWKTPLPGLPPDDNVIEGFLNKYGHLERYLAFMWTVRALLGPPIEALILYDRVLYIQEKLPEAQTVLMPVFDPLLSPRNMALVVIKGKQ